MPDLVNVHLTALCAADLVNVYFEMLRAGNLVSAHLAALRAADLVNVHLAALRAADLVNVRLAALRATDLVNVRLARARISPRKKVLWKGESYFTLSEASLIQQNYCLFRYSQARQFDPGQSQLPNLQRRKS